MGSITDQLLTGMPKVVGPLSGQALRYAREITKDDGTLYASKPGKASPEGRYVWRMVVFLVSPRPQHQCMPVTAAWELGYWTDQRDALTKDLDAIADQIVDAVPVQQWHGVKRWGHALGYL